MGKESRWLRLNANWMRSTWLFVLSAEARLAWVQLLCYVKAEGRAGTAPTIDPLVFSRLNFIGEESVSQMLHAAKADGALTEENGAWTITNWKDYQEADPTNAERQRRFKSKGNADNAVTNRNNSVSLSCATTDSRHISSKEDIGGASRFKKPSVDEVAEYMTKQGLPDARSMAVRFWNYYESKGWLVGKSPMKNWRAAVATWKRVATPTDHGERIVVTRKPGEPREMAH